MNDPRDKTAMALPYEDVRILDFTQLEQGPAATQVLADFGADVIKIERINEGEIGREHFPKINGYSPHWSANNRNKRSLSVDLKDPRGREVVLRLARHADIVASNFRPGVMERLGLGWLDLSAVNRRIIVAYASGYGQQGPYRDRRGQDLAAQAIGGVMALTGDEESGPKPIGTFAIDYVAAMHFAQGMMAALAARERTGRGQVVDSCLLNSAVALHLQEATTYLNTGRLYPRPAAGVAHAHNSPLYGYYRTRDGHWLALIAEFYVSEPWQRICRALDIEELYRKDARFDSVDGLIEHGHEVKRILDPAFERLDRESAIARLEAEDLLAAPVNDYPAVFDDEQVQFNEMVISAEVTGVGEAKFVGIPVKLSDTPGALRFAPPMVGEHSAEVLEEAGFTAEEIEDLREARVIGNEPAERTAGRRSMW